MNDGRFTASRLVVGNVQRFSLARPVVGSIAGTMGGYEFRTRLIRAVGGNDLPIAVLEDVMAIGGALLIVTR